MTAAEGHAWGRDSVQLSQEAAKLMKTYLALLAIFTFTIAAAGACIAPPESIDDAPGVEPDAYGSTCGGRYTDVCYSGRLAGRCDRSGSCCTGCLDAFGACQPGAKSSACGAGGEACEGCARNFACVEATCVQACTSVDQCNSICVDKTDGAACAMCDLPGQCSGDVCAPVVLGPPHCG